jgi:membrane associated rhomboid family serine protease
MIPLRDENPGTTTPYVVYLLIAVNIIVYIIDQLGSRTIPPGIPINGLWQFTMVPHQVVTGDPEVRAQLGRFLIAHEAPTPTWITIFTSMFMHGGLVHIGGNMLYLWIFGDNIEDVLGHFKFLLFYLGGGVIAALAHIASNPQSLVPTVGASGAIAAVLGAYIVLFPNSRVQTLVFYFFITVVSLPAVILLGYWILIQVFFGVGSLGSASTGGVAYFAHIGGFAAGAIGILLLGGRRRVRDRQNLRRYNNTWYEG